MITTEFLLTSLVVILIPGTGVIYTVSNGLFLGKRASFAAACGCTLGITPHLVASILGLSAIMHLSSVAFQMIKFAGAAYLLYLAWGMWRDTGPISLESNTVEKGSFKIMLTGFLINILNPKLSLFFLAFLPLFVPAETLSPMLHMALLSFIFMGMTLIIFIIYGICAHGIRHTIINSPRAMSWLQRGFAAMFGALGIKLALTD